MISVWVDSRQDRFVTDYFGKFYLTNWPDLPVRPARRRRHDGQARRRWSGRTDATNLCQHGPRPRGRGSFVQVSHDQCDQMVTLSFGVWKFTAMKIGPIA